MDMDGHRMGGHRWVGLGWVDIGGVDIGWVSFRCVVVVARSGRVRGSHGGDGREAGCDHRDDGADGASVSIIPCPLSTSLMPRPQTGATSASSVSVVVARNK